MNNYRFGHWLYTGVVMLLMAGVSGCAGNRAGTATGPVLALQQDSGYLSKRDALPFIVSAGLTDAAKRYWRSYDDADTIGKYYRLESTGHFIVLVKALHATELVEALLLLEVDAGGALVRHVVYPSIDYWCLENAIVSFRKLGRYFVITGCGHGSGYSSEYGYVFDRLAPADSINEVYFGGYSYFGRPDPQFAQLVISEMQAVGDSLVMDYMVRKGSKDTDEPEWQPGRTIKVVYRRQGHHWAAADSSLLAEFDME